MFAWPAPHPQYLGLKLPNGDTKVRLIPLASTSIKVLNMWDKSEIVLPPTRCIGT